MARLSTDRSPIPALRKRGAQWIKPELVVGVRHLRGSGGLRRATVQTAGRLGGVSQEHHRSSCCGSRRLKRLARRPSRPRLTLPSAPSRVGGTANRRPECYSAGAPSWCSTMLGGTSRSRAQFFDQTCTAPQAGHVILDFRAGIMAKLCSSVSMPTDTSVSVRGHRITIAAISHSPYRRRITG